MKKVIINYKEAADIFEDYKKLLEKYKRITEEWIQEGKRENVHLVFEDDGYIIGINYYGCINEGEITTHKHYNDIEYIVQTKFVYLNNKVFLEEIAK